MPSLVRTSQRSSWPGPLAVVRERQLWLLVGLGFAYFWRPLLLSQSFFLRDLSFYFLPQKRILAELVSSGLLPVWNPYLQGGQAFLTSVSNSVLAPANLLLLVLPVVPALNLMVVLHFVVGLASAYLLARVLGMTPAASFMVAVTFAFAGPSLSLINLLNHFMAWTLAPLLLAAWYLSLVRGGGWWLVAAVAVGVVQVFCGSPEVSAFTLLLALVLCLCCDPLPRGWVRRLGAWTVLVALIVAVSAVQLLPTMAVVADSPRGFGMSFADIATWSLNPVRLAEMVLPSLLGHVDRLGRDSYWGSQIVDEGYPYLISIYLGLTVLIMAVVAATLGRRSGPMARKARMALLAVAVAAVILALGRFLPGAEVVYDVVPMIDVVRYPSKLIVLAVLPLALLVGCFFDRFFQPDRDFDRRDGKHPFPAAVLAGQWSVLAGLLLLAAVFWSGRGAAVLEYFFRVEASEAMRWGVMVSVIHAAAVILVLTLLLVVARREPKPWHGWLLAATLVVDLGAAGARLNPCCAQELVRDPPQVLSLVQSEVGDGRLYRALSPAPERLRAPSDEDAWRYRWNIEVLGSAAVAGRGVPQIFHQDVVQLSPLPMMKLAYFLESVEWPQRLPVLSAAAVRVVVSHEELELPGLERVGEIDNSSELRFFVYRNRRAVARVAAVSSWTWVASDEKAFAAISRSSFDPRTRVVLTAAPGGTALQPSAPAGAAPPELRVVRSTANSCELVVRTEHHACLVFSEPLAAGWVINVDGRKAPVQRANLAFSAVLLEPGEHRVKRSYRPRWLWIGLAISLLSAVAVVGATALRRAGGWPGARAPRG